MVMWKRKKLLSNMIFILFKSAQIKFYEYLKKELVLPKTEPPVLVCLTVLSRFLRQNPQELRQHGYVPTKYLRNLAIVATCRTVLLILFLRKLRPLTRSFSSSNYFIIRVLIPNKFRHCNIQLLFIFCLRLRINFSKQNQ